MEANRILQGDALGVLKTLPDESVDMCCTSPPYWGLRDYGVEGQIGLEATPEEYVQRLVEVFREVRRALKPAGTLWLNLGDSYATGAGKVGDCPGGGDQGARWRDPTLKKPRGYKGAHDDSPKHKVGAIGPIVQPNRMPIPGLKPKDLVGIPWMTAFALRADGWYLRMDCVWHKPNPMPESVKDRPTKAHEYIFLLSKSERYYYDAGAISEPSQVESYKRRGSSQYQPSGIHAPHTGLHKSGNKSRKYGDERGSPNTHLAGSAPWEGATRNKRSVWTVNIQPYPEAHFATYPEKLIEPCILAGSRPGDIVLDPFIGSGTTGAVALRLNRQYLGIELKPEYIRLANERICKGCKPLTEYQERSTGESAASGADLATKIVSRASGSAGGSAIRMLLTRSRRVIT
jgi:DNA modification methylase